MLKRFIYILFLFHVFTLNIKASECINTEELNSVRRLYPKNDFIAFNANQSAFVRQCTYDRTSFFTRCMDEKIHPLLRAKQLGPCDKSSKQGSSTLKEIRTACAKELAQKKLPNCPSEEYGLPSCKQFAGQINLSAINRCIGTKGTLPDISILKPLAQEMTKNERQKSILFNLRDNLVKSYSEGLRPIAKMRACLQNKVLGGPDKQLEFNGKKVSCSRVLKFLMAKVIMTVPVLRQHQLLSTLPAIRSESEGYTFRKSFNRRFPGNKLSKDEVLTIGRNINDFNHEKLPLGKNPPPTLNEVEEAAQIRQEEFSYRDQQFFEAYKNKQPFKDCIVETKENGTTKLSFVSFKDTAAAMRCGKYTARDEIKRVGPIFTKADELNMGDAKENQAFSTYLSYRSKVAREHKEAVKKMVEENPFLSDLNLTTDDLPNEKDPEEVQATKTQNVYKALLKSFSKMTNTAADELNKVKNEQDIGALRTLLMKKPALIEASIKNQPGLNKRTCDTIEGLYQEEKVSNNVTSALRFTAALAGGFTCPFTWGLGCAFAAGVQLTHVGQLNKEKNLALGEFFMGEGSLDNYLKAESEAFQAKAMVALELVGNPVGTGGKVLLRSFKEAKLLARVAPKGLKAGEELIDNIPRLTFKKTDDIAMAIGSAKRQSNLEVFTVHGPASSHSAVRIGDMVYHTGQGFGKSIGSDVVKNGDFVSEPFEDFIKREMAHGTAVEGITLKATNAEISAMEASAKEMAAKGKSYSLFKNNCSQTVCDIVNAQGVQKTIDVERTFDPLVLREKINSSLGDKAIAQNIYGDPAKLGNSSRRRIMLGAAVLGEAGGIFGYSLSQDN